MWKHRFDRHCSDDRLLAFLDGELHGLARLRTARHLRRCWECRAHLSGLEHQAESLARLMEKQTASQSGRTAEARAAFLAWKEEYERKAVAARRGSVPWARWSLAAAGVCAAIALVFLPRPAERKRAEPDAAEVLRGVRGFQTGLRQKPGTLHQVLNVDVVQSRPVPRRSSGRVEIWSDREGGRYASRWVDERQTLKYAVWRRPGQDPRVFAAVNHRARAGSLFDPEAEGLTVEALERAFFDWLSAQDWQAAPDFTEAISRDGAQLRVERLTSGGIRMHASRAGRAVRAEFSMDVEAGSYRPRLQVMRLETAERALELRVASDRLEVVLLSHVNAAVFEPDVARVTAVPAPPPLLPEPPPPAPAPVEDIETDVLYAIHRVRACVGDSVQLLPAADGEIEVRAIVQNAQRRAELLEAIEQAGGGRAHAQIQIVEQARPGPERANPLLPPDGVRAIDGLYPEALALVRLAERYGPDRTARLTPRQRKLVDLMVRDHMAALRSGSRMARAQVEPLLAALAGAPAEAVAVQAAPDWRAAARGIFRALDQADTLIDVPPEAGRKQAAARLLGALAELEQRVKQLDGSVSAAQR
jgi:hypothetical protein